VVFMPVTSEATPGGLSQWLKSSPVVVLTIFGVLLYAMFSIPAVIFYARLGTSPSEVGFTYASVLSGATFGTVGILSLLVLFAFYIIAMILGIGYLVGGIVMFLFLPGLFGEDRKLDADQFDRKIRIAKRIYPKKESGWAEVERDLRRRRELFGLEERTCDEAKELKHLDSQLIYTRVILSALKHWLRPRIWYVYVLFLVIIGVTGLLVVIARNQADTVLHGETYFGNESGFFAYHADIAYVRPVSTETAKSVQQLVEKRLFLLGENAQYIILYSPDRRSTIRIPVNAVVVTSSP
jgi:hypothetical protein